jgi:hypothetical protein
LFQKSRGRTKGEYEASAVQFTAFDFVIIAASMSSSCLTLNPNLSAPMKIARAMRTLNDEATKATSASQPEIRAAD